MAELTRDDVTILSTKVRGDHRGDWWHIRIDERFYIVSAVDLPVFLAGYRTSETMAFAADETGQVTSWSDLAMVERKDHWACIDQLLESLGGEA